MPLDSSTHEPRTNAEQSETAADLRVSYESRRGARKRRLVFWEVDERTSKPVIVSLNPDGMNDAEYLAEVHRMADELEENDVCYFVGGTDGPVKIGYAKNVKNRLVALQNGSPVRLYVLVTVSGGLTRETAYHYQFAQHRLHGEWFERSPEIEAEIERLSHAPEPQSSSPGGTNDPTK